MTARAPSMSADRYRPVTGRVGRFLCSGLFAWVVSLALHGALLLAFWAVVLRQEAPVRTVIIPEARLAAAPGPVAPSDARPIRVQLDALEPAPADAPIPIEPVPLSVPTADFPKIPAAPSSPPPKTAGLHTDQPVGAGHDTRPSARFFGQVGNAYKVVYVIDVSASQMIYMDQIVGQMRDSIEGLLPTQQFHIVLARPLATDEFAPRRLVPALRRYKDEAFAFLDTVDRTPRPGAADPIEAMRRAFAVEPELIYFLSDGDYRNIQDELEQELQRFNAAGRVAITTIGFEPSPAARELLERIARTHRGHFRMVRAE